MGSGGGNGNDDKVATPPTRAGDFIAGKAAGTRTDSRRPKPGVRQREEERLVRAGFVSGDASYVREAPTEDGRRGDIIRDSSGKGILTAQGVQRAEASRQEELETLIAQRAVPDFDPVTGVTGFRQDPVAEKRKMAIEALEERLDNTLPGFLGAMARLNIENQLRQLREGTGDPQFALTESGTFAPVGVVPSATTAIGLQDTGRGDIAPIFPEREERDEREVTPETDPEVTPEVVPDDALLGASRLRSAERRRSQRRRGGAGTLLEGGGVLYE